MCEDYNGTSWTEVNDLVNAANSAFGAGTESGAIKAGGGPGAPAAFSCETYDGNSWSAGPVMNLGRYGGMAAGTSTSTVTTGGNQPPGYAISTAETFNGTSWSPAASMTTARSVTCGTGVAAGASVCMSGYVADHIFKQSTEEYADPVYAVKTVTSS